MQFSVTTDLHTCELLYFLKRSHTIIYHFAISIRPSFQNAWCLTRGENLYTTSGRQIFSGAGSLHFFRRQIGHSQNLGGSPPLSPIIYATVLKDIRRGERRFLYSLQVFLQQHQQVKPAFKTMYICLATSDTDIGNFLRNRIGFLQIHSC